MSEPEAPAPQSPMDVIKSFGHVSALALLCALLPAIGGFVALGVVIARANEWRPWLAERLAIALPLYALAFALSTGFALMPTYALSFIAGSLFGFWWGGGAALVGVAVGAAIGYAWAALLARDKVMRRIGENPRHAAVRAAIIDRGAAASAGLVALLRFPPNSPFAITNLVMGATGVRFTPFILGTILGMAPRTLLVASFGAAAAELTASAAGAVPGRWKIAGIVITLVVFVFIYWLCNRWAKQALAKLGLARGGVAASASGGAGADDPALG